MITPSLRSGPDIDWRTKCHPGDDQGHSDACSVFAVANWVECVTGKLISDTEAIGAWLDHRRLRYGDSTGGLSITEAFFVAMRSGWIPAGSALRRVSDLQTLALAPLVLGVSGLSWDIEPGTSRLSRISPATNHSCLAVADIAGDIWIENSHGLRWGANGFGVMSHDAFRRHVTQIWQIILPGAPGTLDEAAHQRALSLAETIGTEVLSIARNLQILGYGLPANGRLLMGDIMRRSMLGELSDVQEKAKGNLADVYMMLIGGGVTDAHINAVWDVIKPKKKES